MTIKLTNWIFRDIKQLFFIGHGIDECNKVEILLLEVRLYNIRLGILKTYITYSYKFDIFDIVGLLGIWDERDLLLIVIRQEETLFYLNIIYLFSKYIYQ